MYVNKARIKKIYFFVPDSTNGKDKITETSLIKICIRIAILTHEKIMKAETFAIN